MLSLVVGNTCNYQKYFFFFLRVGKRTNVYGVPTSRTDTLSLFSPHNNPTMQSISATHYSYKH